MKAITMYEANDGSRWDDAERAEKRDALVAECEAFLGEIGFRGRPDGIDFSNGKGFVQQPTGTRDKMLAFLREHGAHRDSDGPIGSMLYQMHCIDDSDRLWGQPYFAINPTAGKQVAL